MLYDSEKENVSIGTKHSISDSCRLVYQFTLFEKNEY